MLLPIMQPLNILAMEVMPVVILALMGALHQQLAMLMVTVELKHLQVDILCAALMDKILEQMEISFRQRPLLVMEETIPNLVIAQITIIIHTLEAAEATMVVAPAFTLQAAAALGISVIPNYLTK